MRLHTTEGGAPGVHWEHKPALTASFQCSETILRKVKYPRKVKKHSPSALAVLHCMPKLALTDHIPMTSSNSPLVRPWYALLKDHQDPAFQGIPVATLPEDNWYCWLRPSSWMALTLWKYRSWHCQFHQWSAHTKSTCIGLPKPHPRTHTEHSGINSNAHGICPHPCEPTYWPYWST